MKALVLIASGALILCGCEKAPETWETKSLAWPRDPFTGKYLPKAYLIVYVNGERIQTNFPTVEATANYLGQYGWEVINVERGVYHLKRHPQSNGDFMFSEYPLKDEYPDPK